MTALELTKEPESRLHNIYDHIKDEHKLRLLNHVFALIFSTLLTGLITHWALDVMSVCYSANGPLTIMEIIDYARKF